MNQAITGKSLLELVCDVEGLFHPSVPASVLSKHAGDVWDQSLVARAKQTVHVKHASDRAYGVRSTTEAKEINTVAVFVGVHQELVSPANLVEQTASETETDQTAPLFFDETVSRGRAHGAHAGVVIRPLVRVDDQSAVQFNDVRVIVGDELISRPVAANYDVLSHGYLLGGNTDTGIFSREQERSSLSNLSKKSYRFWPGGL